MSWIKTLLYTIFVGNVVGQMTNKTSYGKLPPLYSFHNYEDSLARPLPSTYCLVFAQIQPDNHSALWHSIEALSNDSIHRYRHDYLFFGLCVEKCRELLQNKSTNPLESQLLDRKATPDNEVIDHYRRIFARDVNYDHLLHHDLLDECVNYEFQQKYNLTLSTSVEYCNTAGQDSKIGYLEVIAYLIVAWLIFSNIFSSVYDYCLKRQQMSPNHQNKNPQRQELDSLGSSILTSFSISRNYKKMVASTNDNDLQFTYFFRFFTSCIVILGHVIMIISASPLANPEFIETRLYHSATIILQNGSTLLQIFFVLTGFLVKLKFDQQKHITTKSGYGTSIFVYFLGCFRRYLRMLPSLTLLIFFNATLLKRLGQGPFGSHMVQAEHTFCTEHWWKNIFMINNFMMKDSCAHHTWYMAADMQLIALYLLVLIITAKFTRTKKPIYTLLGILAFIVPGVLTYIYRLESNVYLKPEYYRYLYFKDNPTLHISYCPSYCNLGGFLVGFICAEIYQSGRFHEMKAAFDKYRKEPKLQMLYLVLTLSTGFGLLFSGLLVKDHSNAGPSILIAVYAGCYRNLWSIFGGFTILSMLMKFGGIAYDMCCAGVFRVLGRITFQMYVWHVAALLVFYGNYRQSHHISNLNLVGHTILLFIVTIVVGFIMTLFVEYPIGNIINCLLKQVLIPKTQTVRAMSKKSK